MLGPEAACQYRLGGRPLPVGGRPFVRPRRAHERITRRWWH